MTLKEYLQVSYKLQCGFCENRIQTGLDAPETKAAFLRRASDAGWTEVVWPGTLSDKQALACPQCRELWRKAAF